jgi:hypothetical protein
MSNLLQTAAGRYAVREAAVDMLKKRLRRFFERNTVIAFDDWVTGTNPTIELSSILSTLNPAHDAEVENLFSALAVLGALPATLDDINIYVDGIKGNDVTGDGTTTAPYATLWFLEDLCKTRLDHHVRIVVNILTEVDTLDVEPNIGNGTFAIVGQSTYVTSDPGGILTAVTPVNVGPPVTPGTVLTVGAAAWVPHDWRQCWVRVKDGVNAGQVYPITDNTATTLTIDAYDLLPAMGDDIEIIIPGNLIVVNDRFCVRARTANPSSPAAGNGAKISILNLRIVDAGTMSGRDSVTFSSQDLEMQASFVRVESQAQTLYYWTNIKTSLNGQAAYDTLLLNYTGLGGAIANLDVPVGGGNRNCGLTVRQLGILYTDTELTRDNTSVYCVCTFTPISATGNNILLAYSSSASHQFYGRCTQFGSTASFVRDINTNVAVLLNDVEARYTLCTFEGGTNVFELSNAKLHLTNCFAIVGNFTNVGVNVVRLSSVVAEGSPAAISGANGDTLWSSIGAVPPGIAWPANLAGITDGIGSFISRRD